MIHYTTQPVGKHKKNLVPSKGGKKVVPVRAQSLSEVKNLSVEDSSRGQRVDNYLFSRLKAVPKSHIYRVIRSGEVRVNSGRVRPSHKLKVGDVVRVPPVSVAAASTVFVDEQAVERFKTSVIFEDKHVLVINKSGYIPAHGGSRHNYGLAEISHHLRGKTGFLSMAHRLDRSTSGCLLFAKTREALLEVQEAFRSRRVGKIYTALVVGAWDDAVSSTTAPLAFSLKARRKKVVVDIERGKSAMTGFEIIKRFKRCTLLKVTPKTGRMHQIRVHAATCGHPVAGDRHYGDDADNRHFHDLGLRRLFLHASELRLKCVGRTYRFHAPLPEDIAKVLVTIKEQETEREA